MENTNYGTATDDQSQLGKPINIGFSGIQHVIRCLKNGTTEIRDLLLNECELLYECRSCRNLFRSLANFLIHKRDYCTDHFCEKMVLFTAEDSPDKTVVVEPESPGTSDDNNEESASVQENENAEITDAEHLSVEVSPPKISDPMIIKAPAKTTSNPVTTFYNRCVQKVTPQMNDETPNLALKSISTNPNAVFQSINKQTTHSSKTERVDYYVPSSEETSAARLNKPPENKVEREEDVEKYSESVKIKRNDCKTSSPNNFKCTVCESQFRTARTLEFHMRINHVVRELRFSCPMCTTTFTQIFSVGRHLMTVHKLGQDEALRMRDAVRQKAHLKRLNVMTNSQCGNKKDASSLVCKNCSRHFRKRSSWVIHEKFCMYKLLYKEQNKSSEESSSDKELIKPKASRPNDEVAHVSSRGSKPNDRTSQAFKGSKAGDKTTQVTSSKTSKLSDETREGASKGSSRDSVSSVPERPKRNARKKASEDFVDMSAKGHSRAPNRTENSISKKTPEAIEKEVLAIVNIKKIQCLKCHRRFSSFANLRRHAAIHIGWNRFKCKYCDYQSYNRSDCRSHVRRVHLKKKTASVQVDKYVLDLPFKTKESTDTVFRNEVEEKSPEIMQCKVTLPQLPLVASSTSKAALLLPNSSLSSVSRPKEKSLDAAVKNLHAAVVNKQKNENTNDNSNNVVVNGVNYSDCDNVRNTDQGTSDLTKLNSDNMLTLVTRSGSYSKANILRKYFEDRNLDMKGFKVADDEKQLVATGADD